MALGAFNSSILSLYFLFFRKNDRVAGLYLGALLAVLSIRIWKSIFFYFNPELSKVYLQIGLSACFLIGPLLVNYILSMEPWGKKYKKALLAHLLLSLLLISLIGVAYPYTEYPELWGTTLYKIINYQWMAYVLLGGWLCRHSWLKLIRDSNAINEEDVWVLSVYTGVALIWLSYFFSSFTSYIMGALCFSFTLYLSALLIFLQRRRSKNVYKPKYEGQQIPQEQAKLLLSQVDQLMTQQKQFTDPGLTLMSMAKSLRVRPHLLSQLLNEKRGQNFPQFVNTYRIAQAKEMLEADSPLKMEAIAEECGFNSTSTFYAAFKRETGTTPAKYAQKHKP